MKRLARISTVAAAFIAPVMASTMAPTVAAAQELPALRGAYDWSGLYIGATIGHAQAEIDASNMLLAGTDYSIEPFGVGPEGMIGGATAGYNRQFGRFVAGIEGDFSAAALEDSYTDTTFNFRGTGELEWLATLRARLGIAMDRFMVYGTGGLAFGEVRATLDDYYTAGTVTSTDSHTHVGWTAGGGVEYALTEHVTLKGEGLYYDLGTEGYTFIEDPDRVNPITLDAETTGWLARAGVNVKF